MIKLYIAAAVLLLVKTSSFAQPGAIPFEGYNRTYLVHLPDGYTGNDALPLVIAMHGGGGNANSMQNISSLSDKADIENFIVVYPEGVNGGFFGLSSWNAGDCCGFASTANINDVGFIDSLLNTLISQYSIDTDRIYATGMSNGGFLAYRLACELSDRIAAIAPVECSMTMTDCTPVRAVPIIHFHSYLDENIPYMGGIGSGPSNHYNPPQDSVMAAWANLNSCTILNDTIVNDSQYTLTQWRNGDCSSEIHHYITTDGGHSWPGNLPNGSSYVNATDLMWEFFQQYSLSCEDEGQSFDFQLFPNPSSGIVFIDIQESEFTSTVSDKFGNVILTQANKKILNLRYLPAGVYYISIQVGDQVIAKQLILTE